jgi:predicted outer membrane repeat protein
MLGAQASPTSVTKTLINIASTNFEGNTALENGGVLAVKFDN